MPQNPLQCDAIQIEPSSGDTLTISRDSSDGSLSFVDAVLPNGIKLNDLAGVKNIDDVYVVGTGAGASYTSIQAAIDAVDPTKTSPQVILVMSGLYLENLILEKSLSIIGIGMPIIRCDLGPTVWIKEAVTSVPKKVILNGVQLETTKVIDSCVKVTGGSGSEVGSDGIFITNCNLKPGASSCYLLHASSTARIYCTNGNWYMGEEANTASIKVKECGEVVFSGMPQLPYAQIDCDGTGALPTWTDDFRYIIKSVGTIGNIQSTITGLNPKQGTLTIRSSKTGDVTFTGDANSTCVLHGCESQALTCDGSSMVSLYGSRTTVTGTGTIQESIIYGSEIVDNAASVTVTLDVNQPDANYTVNVETDFVSAYGVTAKGAALFTVSFDGAQTGTLYWTIVRA